MYKLEQTIQKEKKIIIFMKKCFTVRELELHYCLFALLYIYAVVEEYHVKVKRIGV